MKDSKVADKWRDKGNLLYKQKHFQRAVVAYNKSLCYSVLGSKQLALAYGNRSAVYLEVGFYDECLENVKLARENNHPDHSRLIDREVKCLEAQEEQIKDPEDDPEEFIKLSYEPNKKIPFIVDCLEMRENEQFGRHIITTRDLSPGDIIALEEPVFKTIEGVETRYNLCICCLNMKKLNLIPCEGCSFTMFCSKSCMKQSMDKFHKNECFLFKQFEGNLDSFLYSMYPNALRFFKESRDVASIQQLKSLLKKSAPVSVFDFDFSNSNDQDLGWNRLRIFNGLVASTHREDLEECKETVKLAMDMDNDFTCTSKHYRLFFNFLVRLMLIFEDIFWYSVEAPIPVEFKAATCFWMLMNHSCDPNIRSAKFGTKQVLFVTKPIKKNEQLFTQNAKIPPGKDEQCSCPAYLNSYQAGNSTPFSDPPFISWPQSMEPFSGSTSWKARISQLSEYIKNNFKSYPSAAIQTCEYGIGIIFNEVSWYQDWPFFKKTLK